MIIKEGIIDRIEQTIKITFKNYKFLIVPIVLFQIIFGTLYGILYKTLLPMVVGSDFIEKLVMASSGSNAEMLGLLFQTSFLLFIAFGFLTLFISAILFIPIKVAVIKGVSNVTKNEENDCGSNIKYGFNNFLNSFKVYWYIFEYVYLIPSIILILLLLLGLMGMISLFNMGGGEEFIVIGGIAFFLFFIIAIPFIIIRGIKSVFAFSNAVDTDNFTKEEFKKSIEISKNSKLRILGNLILTGLIIGIVSNIVMKIFSSIISLFQPDSSQDQELIDSIQNGSINSEELLKFDIFDTINSLILDVINGIGVALITVFVFLLYKRLAFENRNKQNQTKEEIKVEEIKEKQIEL